jgi:hypothetical protein
MSDPAKLKRRIGAARKFWERSHYRPTRGGKPTPLVLAIASAEKVAPDVVARVVAAALAQAELEALAELCE